MPVFSSSQTPSGKGASLKAVGEVDFTRAVIDGSKDKVIVVDFWAPWCGPCRQLTPILIEAAKPYANVLALVGVNIDQAPQIASALRIQSVPRVLAFWQKRPVDGFDGAQPASVVRDKMTQWAKLTGGSSDSAEQSLMTTARTMIEQGSFAEAAGIFAQLLGQDPDMIPAILGLAQCYQALGDYTRASAIMADLEVQNLEKNDQEIFHRLHLSLNLNQASQSINTDVSRRRLEADAGDHSARLNLAKALFVDNNREEAVNILLEGVGMDNDWNDGAFRRQLLDIFTIIGSRPLAKEGRRRLSGLIFR